MKMLAVLLLLLASTAFAAEFDNVTIDNQLTLSNLTPGSIPFVGVGGAIVEDNVNFKWVTATGQMHITQPEIMAALPALTITVDVGGLHGNGGHIAIDGNPGGGGTIYRTDGGLNKSQLQLYGGDLTGTTGGGVYINGNNSTEGDAGGIQTTFGLTTSTFQLVDQTQSINLFTFDNYGVETVQQATTPANPPATQNSLYFKSDDNFYVKSSSGVERQVSFVGPVPYVHTVTGTDISNGGFTLSYTPSNTQSVLVDVVSGCRQINGLDYVVGSPNAANFVSWAGLGLSTLLISGDKILISYSN